MIGHKNIPAVGGRQVRFADHLIGNMEIFQYRIGEVQPFPVTVTGNKIIDIVLMDHFFQIGLNKPGNHFGYSRIFASEKLFDIDRF